MSLDNARDKYRNDPYYHSMVDCMVKWLGELATPFELREAAMFASIKFEMDNVRNVLSVPPDIQRAMQRIDEYIFENENKGSANFNINQQTQAGSQVSPVHANAEDGTSAC